MILRNWRISTPEAIVSAPSTRAFVEDVMAETKNRPVATGYRIIVTRERPPTILTRRSREPVQPRLKIK